MLKMLARTTTTQTEVMGENISKLFTTKQVIRAAFTKEKRLKLIKEMNIISFRKKL